MQILCCMYTPLSTEICNSQLHRFLGNTWALHMYFGLHISVITHLNSNSLKNKPAHKISPIPKAVIPAIIILYCLLQPIISLFELITENPPNLT